MFMLPMTLGDPYVSPNHLKPPHFLHFALPYAPSQLVITKTSHLMYRLNVQITAYGQQTVSVEKKSAAKFLPAAML